MSRKTLVVVCEVGKPPYAAELSFGEMVKLLRDSLEYIRPATVKAWGNECPLSDGLTIIAGGNARVRDDRPPPNRFGLLGNLLIAGVNGHSIRRDRIEAVIQQIKSYDAGNRSFRIPGGAVDAPRWESLGREWSPDAHLTGDVRRTDEIEFINSLLSKHASYIVAHYLYRPLPVMYSLELQFADSPEGRERARMFLNEYQSGFDARGKLKKGVAVAVRAALGDEGQVQS